MSLPSHAACGISEQHVLQHPIEHAVLPQVLCEFPVLLGLQVDVRPALFKAEFESANGQPLHDLHILIPQVSFRWQDARAQAHPRAGTIFRNSRGDVMDLHNQTAESRLSGNGTGNVEHRSR